MTLTGPKRCMYQPRLGWQLVQEASLWWSQRPRSKHMFQGYKIHMVMWPHMEAMDGQWGVTPENAKRTVIADLRGSASLQLTWKNSEAFGKDIKPRRVSRRQRSERFRRKGTKLVSLCASVGPLDLGHVANFPQVPSVWVRSSGSTSAGSAFHLHIRTRPAPSKIFLWLNENLKAACRVWVFRWL